MSTSNGTAVLEMKPPEVEVLAKEVAKRLPDVVVEGTDLTVEVKPLTFRREYYKTYDTWVNWVWPLTTLPTSTAPFKVL